MVADERIVRGRGWMDMAIMTSGIAGMLGG